MRPRLPERLPAQKNDAPPGDPALARVAHTNILAAITRSQQGGDIVARAVLGGAKGASGFATRFAALVTDGPLGEDTMVATVLESRDLTRPWIT